MDRKKLDFIVFLRAFACIMVLLAHLWLLFWYGGGAGGIFQYLKTTKPICGMSFVNITPYLVRLHLNFGSLGVATFFLITGFLAGLSLSSQSPLKYLQNKVLRIYPMYIVGFSITFLNIWIYTKATGHEFLYGFTDWLRQVSLFRDLLWVPSIDELSWTLEAQIKFHFLIAIIAAVKKEHSGRTLVEVAMVISVASALLALNKTRFLSYVILTRFSEILGLASFCITYMLIGLILYQHYSKEWSTIKTIIVGVLIYMCFVLSAMSYTDNAYDFILNYTIILVAFILLYSYSFIEQQKLINSKPVRFVADISYPLYIIHGLNGYIVMTGLYMGGVNPYICFGIAVTMFVFLAWLLHRLVELPISNAVKRNLFKQNDRR